MRKGHEEETTLALGRAVRDRRKRLGLSQSEAADLAGCSRLFISQLEGGKTTVRLDILLRLLNALGLALALRHTDGRESSL